MKKHFFYIVSIVCLLAFNCILFFYSKYLTKEMLIAKSEVKDGYTEELLQTIYGYLSIDGRDLNENIIIKSLVNKLQGIDETCQLKDVLKENNIICFFPLISCHTCLEKQLIKLDNMRRMGYKKHIIVLTDHISDDTSYFIYKNNIKLDFFELENGNIGFSLPNYSILLMETLKNHVKTSFILTQETEKYDDCFYSVVNLIDEVKNPDIKIEY